MSSSRPIIGIFDSGAGGFSILEAARRLLPNGVFVYVYDQGFFPYGTKSEKEVSERVSSLCGKVLARYPLDYVVIACNTASTVVLPVLRGQLSQAVVGVVPAIKPAAALSKTKVIGLLATEGTIARSYTQELIEAHATGCTVLKLGSTRMVELAEAKLRGEAVDLGELHTILAPLLAHPDLDTLVLGCTHFPLLLPELTQVLPQRIQMVEPSLGVARRLASLVTHGSYPVRNAEGLTEDLLLCTAEIPHASRLLARFGFAAQELLV